MLKTASTFAATMCPAIPPAATSRALSLHCNRNSVTMHAEPLLSGSHIQSRPCKGNFALMCTENMSRVTGVCHDDMGYENHLVIHM